MERTMTVDLTQYMMPDGRQVPVTINLDESLRPQYDRMKEDGRRFAAEMLRTSEISLTIEDIQEEEDIDIRIVPNGPEVPTAMEDMLRCYSSPCKEAADPTKAA